MEDNTTTGLFLVGNPQPKRERVQSLPPGHGRSKARNGKPSPTYNSWRSMKNRCLVPNNIAYHRYGGRGITIDPRWLGRTGFVNFLSDMGPRPEGKTLDRIDNDKGYRPDNCKWSTWKEQCNNRRPRFTDLMKAALAA
jgi:hypothetical protein